MPIAGLWEGKRTDFRKASEKAAAKTPLKAEVQQMATQSAAKMTINSSATVGPRQAVREGLLTSQEMDSSETRRTCRDVRHGFTGVCSAQQSPACGREDSAGCLSITRSVSHADRLDGAEDSQRQGRIHSLGSCTDCGATGTQCGDVAGLRNELSQSHSEMQRACRIIADSSV
jgi:hypothetical protein